MVVEALQKVVCYFLDQKLGKASGLPLPLFTH